MPEQNNANAGGDTADNEMLSPLIKTYIDQQIQDAKGTEQESRKKKWKNSWRSASPITKGTFFLTAALVASTILYTMVAGFQLSEMRRTNRNTEMALDNAKQASFDSSNQFQAQLHHFDAGLGVNGLQIEKMDEGNKQSRNLVKAAQHIYEAADRPYVGIDTVIVSFWLANGQQLNESQYAKADHMNVFIFIRNFGTVPGENLVHGGEFHLNGIELKGTTVPSSPTEIFPTQAMRVAGGTIGGADYKNILSGGEILQDDVILTYSYAGKNYKYCNKMQYSPNSANFINLGAKCGPPWATGPKP